MKNKVNSYKKQNINYYNPIVNYQNFMIDYDITNFINNIFTDQLVITSSINTYG